MDNGQNKSRIIMEQVENGQRKSRIIKEQMDKGYKEIKDNDKIDGIFKDNNLLNG